MASGEYGIGKIKDLGGDFRKIGQIKFSKSLGTVQQVGRIEQLTLGDTQQRDIARILGGTSDDYRLAGRILKLKQRHPMASLPELVTMDWLNRRGSQYVFQAKLDGGRSLRGGIVPDFVLQERGGAMILAVQGEYWHTTPGKKESDRTQKLRALGQTFGGQRITDYVSIWEDDIYHKRPMIFEFALAGIGLRG